MCVLSHVQLLATLWTVAHQAPLSIGFPRQEYWSGLSLPSSGIFPDQGSNLCLLHLQVDSLPLSYLGSPNKEERALNKLGLPGSGVGIKKIPFIP